MSVKVLTLGIAPLLTINPNKCTGCRTCEMACSFIHYKVFNPLKSAITIVKNEEKELCVPVICQQCDDPPCAKACPVEALAKEAETGIVIFDENKCTLCRACITACPYAAIHIIQDASGEKLVKCDFCKGDPECAKRCDPKAIMFTVDPELKDKVDLIERRKKIVEG